MVERKLDWQLRGGLGEAPARDKAPHVRATPIARLDSPVIRSSQWLPPIFPSPSSAPLKMSINSSGPYFSLSSPSPSQNPVQRLRRRLHARSPHRIWLIFDRLQCDISSKVVQSHTHAMCPKGSRPRQTSPGLVAPSPEGNSTHVPFEAPKRPSCTRKLVGRP
jgi:hypothetical protein